MVKKAVLNRERDMVYWLPEACRALRIAYDHVPSEIAARMRTDQSRISRFESHGLKQFPRDLNRLLGAYADELGLTVPMIWETAAMLWRCDLAKRVTAEDVQRIVEEVAQKARQRHGSKQAAAPGPPR